MTVARLPRWFKVRTPAGNNYLQLKGLMRRSALHTVCEEAHCPNIGECWDAGTAAFMILGDICTRRCSYCAVTTGRPKGLDVGEPMRLARTIQTLGLRYAVITSVNRDDLPDGGAAIFAQCLQQIRSFCPKCLVEVLIPDFMGDWDALGLVVRARPFVLNHNIETVPRIFPRARPKGRYERSLRLLAKVKDMDGHMTTKSGLMVGLGETKEEVLSTLSDLRSAGCEIVTIGQYLRPSEKHMPIDRFWSPEEFEGLAAEGRRLGFRHVEAGPLVRSSYHAHEQARSAYNQTGGVTRLGGRADMACDSWQQTICDR